jgi:hypothetical protein
VPTVLKSGSLNLLEHGSLYLLYINLGVQMRLERSRPSWSTTSTTYVFLSNTHFDTVIRLRAGRPRNSGSVLERAETVLFAGPSRPAPRCAQPPIQWVPANVSQRVRRWRREPTTHLDLAPRLKKAYRYVSIPPHGFMGARGQLSFTLRSNTSTLSETPSSPRGRIKVMLGVFHEQGATRHK